MDIDSNLIRLLLLELENRPLGSSPIHIKSLDNYDEFIISRHLQYLNSLGYISGKAVQGGFFPESLTGSGKNYLDDIRDKSIIIRNGKFIIRSFISFTKTRTGKIIEGILIMIIGTFICSKLL